MRSRMRSKTTRSGRSKFFYRDFRACMADDGMWIMVLSMSVRPGGLGLGGGDVGMGYILE